MHFVATISLTHIWFHSHPHLTKLPLVMKMCSYCTWVLSCNLPELSNHRPDKEDCSFEDGNDIILFENACTHYTNVDVWLVYLKPEPMPVS